MITPTAERTAQRPRRLTTPSIETERLSLTPLRKSDLDGFIAVFADPRSARMTHAVPHPLNRDDAEKLLTQMMAAPRTHWAIRLEDEQLIGIISLKTTTCGKPAGLDCFGPNLSLFIAPEHQRRGYGLEAIEGLLRWCRKRRIHRVIHAAHFADNEASAQTMIAADFLYTGRRTTETSMAREGEHLALHMIRIL
ncbi:MAG: GNAT family N-acetyltransferase [Asticcacaulis sp.]